MSVKNTRIVATLAAVYYLATPGALAQQSTLDAVLACRPIEDAEARLQCFDTAAGELAAANETGDLVAVSRSDIEAVERDSFGLSLPSLPFFTRRARSGGDADAMADADRAREDTMAAAENVEVVERDSDGNIERIRMRVDSARRSNGRWIFTMENGQVWEQVGTDRAQVPRNMGDDFFVEIRSGAIGSFLLHLPTQRRAVRVRRLQ